MKFRFLCALALALSAPGYAWATCGPFAMKDAAASSTNFLSTTDGGGNCFFKGSQVDSTGANAYPAAAALGDAVSNPTTILLGSMNMLWNGATWDRWDGVNTGSAKTDMSSIAGTATVTGGVNGSLGIGGLAASGATGAGSPVKVGGIFNTTQPTVTNTQAVDAQFSARGSALVTPGVEGFPITATQTGTWTVQPGNTPNTSPWLVARVATTTGGCSSYYKIATASTNATNIKNGAGTVCDVQAFNGGTTIQTLRIYDAGTGFAGCNANTNLLWYMPIPASAAASGVGGGYVVSFTVGRAFGTGLSICITGALGDTDTTSAATTTSVNIGYK